MNKIFRPGNILIPKTEYLEKWSVVACDQFTSSPEYWSDVANIVGNNPSTLNLIIPEIYLNKYDANIKRSEIESCMTNYLERSIFEIYENSYIYVERELDNGSIRHGLMGIIDLEAYDYSKSSVSPVRATEGTVESRLPARVKVRETAILELPHIMMFIDDKDNFVFDSIETNKLIYDFDLMKNGGHIKGYLVSDNDNIDKAIEKLSDSDVLNSKYNTNENPVIFAMGDGNHSLAAAKKYWNELKLTLTKAEAENHPARFALVELVNIHDASIEFEPIHRVLFDTDNKQFIFELKEKFKNADGNNYEILAIGHNQKENITIKSKSIGSLIDECESFVIEYITKYGGTLDYIHGDNEAEKMSEGTANAGILLPKMDKDELFKSVILSGPFPKKSFSIGIGIDKRYYLECRKIK